MAGFARLSLLNPLWPPVDGDGNFRYEIQYELCDPVLQNDGVHGAKLVSTTVLLPSAEPASHADVILAAIIADAAALNPPFNVTENRCSIPVFDGDGQRLKISRDVPADAFDITINNNVDHHILEPAATLTSGTLTMPSKPSDRQVISFSSTQAITALTLLPNAGQTMPNPITTLSAGGFAYYMYRAANTRWYRVG